MDGMDQRRDGVRQQSGRHRSHQAVVSAGNTRLRQYRLMGVIPGVSSLGSVTAAMFADAVWG